MLILYYLLGTNLGKVHDGYEIYIPLVQLGSVPADEVVIYAHDIFHVTHSFDYMISLNGSAHETAKEAAAFFVFHVPEYAVLYGDGVLDRM